MRIFFHGSSACSEAHNKKNSRIAGFILPATVAAVLICTCLYCACFALISARHELLKKQTAEWDSGLEQYNTEINARYGELYAAD